MRCLSFHSLSFPESPLKIPNHFVCFKQRSGPDHVDIITFYNEVFIPAVKPLLVELAPGGTIQRSGHVTEPRKNNEGR